MVVHLKYWFNIHTLPLNVNKVNMFYGILSIVLAGYPASLGLPIMHEVHAMHSVHNCVRARVRARARVCVCVCVCARAGMDALVRTINYYVTTSVHLVRSANKRQLCPFLDVVFRRFSGLLCLFHSLVLSSVVSLVFSVCSIPWCCLPSFLWSSLSVPSW